MKSGWLKLALINIGVTLGLLFGLNLLITAVGGIGSLANALLPTKQGTDEDNKAALPNYASNPEVAATHFQEFETLDTEYQSFTEWSRRPYTGETITINAAGDRVHAKAPSVTGTPAAVYFFGGSTMWGTGVLDDQTIPAYFQEISQLPSENKGETAFVSRQSLNQFLNLLATTESEIRTVVFYEGVNDVQYSCRADEGVLDHARTAKFSAAIATYVEDTQSEQSEPNEFLAYLDTLFLRGIRRLAIGIGDSINPDRVSERIDKTLICDDSPERATQVAQHLMLNWETAHQIAQARGITLIAVLQPVSYLDNSPLDHLELDAELEKQFEAVYPRLQQMIQASGHPWILDYSANLFPPNEYVYIDFCHLSENGNRYVADRLHQDLQTLIPTAP
jgi:Na+-transporting methylmalonyl-CoA/oxaloacetate decarboxylase gamma subunit